MNGPEDDGGGRAALDAFAKQICWCESLGSPFTARLLTVLVDDIAAGGATAESARRWAGDPVADALPLRMAAALHALALTEAAPRLVACYPPHAVTMEQLRSIVTSVVEEHRTTIRTFLSSAPQTNEVGRSGVLAGGFLQSPRKLACRFVFSNRRQRGAEHHLGPLPLSVRRRVGRPSVGGADRAGLGSTAPAGLRPCAGDRTSCLRHLANRSRRRRSAPPPESLCLARSAGTVVPTERAIGLARAHGPRAERADAAEWVRGKIRQPTKASATVLYHSIMWQYLPAEFKADIRASLGRACDWATSAAPLAWLRFEPLRPDSPPELRLTSWPGAREVCLAVAYDSWEQR